MGRKCVDTECSYLAEDGSCLLPESDLNEKCQAIERVGYEEKDDSIYEDYAIERLKSLGILQ